MSLFISTKSLDAWLAEYSISHQHPSNKRIHYICVPAIFISIVALIMNLSGILLALTTMGVLWFYFRLSLVLFMMMATFIALCIGLVVMASWHWSVWVGIFIFAWIGQFIGHKIEGAKPSFFEDLQFLLIGPAWIAMNFMPAT